MVLTLEQRQRFARQIALPEIGVRGQQRLLAGRVLLVGAGGLAAPAGMYLAAAGVGTLGIMDDDVVERANLQRQIFYTAADVGRYKVTVAAKKMRAIHPALSTRTYRQRLTARNAAAIFKDYDFIIDAVDSAAAKRLIARVCHKLAKPYAHGGVSRYRGQTLTVQPGRTACLQCICAGLWPDTRARPGGPLGSLPGIIGAIQATEAIKYLLGIGVLLYNRLLIFDALSMQFRSINLNRNPACALCAPRSRAPAAAARLS